MSKLTLALHRLSLAAAWAGVALIVILSLVPGRERPHTGFTGHQEHFAAYALTGIAFAFALQNRRGRMASVVGLALLAAGMEFAQKFSPGRHPDVSDALFSSLGGVAGIAVGTVTFVLLGRFARKPNGGNPRGRQENQRKKRS